MTKNQLRGLIAASLLCSALPALAIPVTSSTTSLVTFRNCVQGATVCDGISAASNFYAGAPGDASTTNNQTDGVSAVDSSAAITPARGGAELQALVRSAEGVFDGARGTRQGANLASLQRFTYDGPVATTLTFFGSLRYDQTVPADSAGFPNPAATTSQVYGQIAAFVIDDMSIDAGTTAEDNFNTLFNGDFAGAAGFALLGFDEATGPGTTGAGTETLAVSFMVNPGQSVWLYSLIQAIAVNGAIVEGSLKTAIPEPGTLALAALSLLGVAAARRRPHDAG